MKTDEHRPRYGLFAIRGAIWRYAAYFGGKILVFVSTIFLARLLSKEDFGVVGYALTAIAFLDVASDLGVAEAIIYSKDEKKGASTAFWIGIFIGITLFVISWFVAPLLVLWFKDERLLLLFRIIALTFPFTALGSTHEAILRKNLEFERATIPVFVRALSKGVISIILALLDYGAWSLVWGQVIGTLISSILLWLLTTWRPTYVFNLFQARTLINFGIKDIGADFLAMVLLNLDYWLIGRYLGAEALGIYTIAYRLPELLILQFARIISQVVFPIYTKMRDIDGRLGQGFEKTILYVSLVTIPLGLGLALVAKPFVSVFLTEKWIDTVPVLRMIALYSMFLSLIHNSSSIYRALGKFKVITYLSLIRLIILFPALWWATAIKKSILIVGQMHALIAFLACLLGLVVSAKILEIQAFNIFVALRPAVINGLVMSTAVWIVLTLTTYWSSLIQLILATIAGVVIVIISMWLLNRDIILKLTSELRSAIESSYQKLPEGKI